MLGCGMAMGEATLHHALEDFTAIYMPSRNLALRTRAEYRGDLQDLILFLEQLGVHKAADIRISHLDRYLAGLDEKGYTGSTRKRKAVTIRAFLSFLYREGIITNDISRLLVLPFSEATFPRVMSQTEYQRLLDMCAGSERDTAMVELLLQTGIRLSELVKLSLSDIELTNDGNGSIRVTSGGNLKSRTLPLNTKACEAMKAYLATRPDSTAAHVFLNRFKKPLGPRGVQKLITNYLKDAGIKDASVHTLRHTFGAHHAAKGTKIKTIQDVMGHQDIRTTETYASLAKEIVRKEMEEHSL